MAYTAWNVVFGEQPTAAKWNQLGQNDAGFKDGTNIDDSAILTRHVADGNVTSRKFLPNSFRVTKGQITYSASANTNFDLTDHTYTITPPVDMWALVLSKCRFGNANVTNQLYILLNGSTANTEDSFVGGSGTAGGTINANDLVPLSAGVPSTIKNQARSSAANPIIYSSTMNIILFAR